MPATQPPDEWEFLPRDEELDTDEPEAIAPEAMAEFVETHATTPEEIFDSLDAEASPGPDREAAPVVPFPDEEPDLPRGWATAPGSDDDLQPDLEEILESQHYAFEPDDET